MLIYFMANRPQFPDTRPNIRRMREIAYSFLVNVKVSGGKYGNTKFPPVAMGDAMRRAFFVPTNEAEASEAIERFLDQIIEPYNTFRQQENQEYDPAREARETERMENAEQIAQIREYLRDFFKGILLPLIDHSKTVDPTWVRETAVPAVKNAGEFVAQKVVHIASSLQMETRKNTSREAIDRVARAVDGQNRARNVPVENTEVLDRERYHVEQILRSVHRDSEARSNTVHLFHSMLNNMIAAYEGKGRLGESQAI